MRVVRVAGRDRTHVPEIRASDPANTCEGLDARVRRTLAKRLDPLDDARRGDLRKGCLLNESVYIAPDVKLGKDVKLAKFINLYGCEIGDETKIGTFVEVQKNAKVGRRCKISSHTFICEGVTIEDHVLIGHGVTFINDSYPRATTPTGELQTEKDWKVEADRKSTRLNSSH